MAGAQSRRTPRRAPFGRQPAQGLRRARDVLETESAEARAHAHCVARRACGLRQMSRYWQGRIDRMRAICAWCESEGRPSDLGEREPFYNPAVTHCLCVRHRERLLELLPSRSFPDVELLIGVRRSDPALYERLQRSLASV